MSKKTATIYTRIEPEIKAQAEEVLESVGISPSDAVNAFYRQIIYNNGIPFKIKAKPLGPTRLNLDNWTKRQFVDEMNRGINSAKAGRTRPATDFFAKMEAKNQLWIDTK